MSGLPPPTEPLVDTKTGLINEVWYRYLNRFVVTEEAKDTKSFFQVDLNTTNLAVAVSASSQLIAFNHEVIDTDSCFDTTLSAYKPAENGYYQFYVQASAARSSLSFATQPTIMKNTSVVFKGTALSPAASTNTQSIGICNGFLNLTTADSITFGVVSPSTVISGAVTDTFAYGYKIGST